MINDFGWVIFDINQTEPRDTGEWTCVAKNSAGEARCSAILNILGRDSIVCDPIQLQSLQRIQEIEAIKPLPGEPPSKVITVAKRFKFLLQPMIPKNFEPISLNSPNKKSDFKVIFGNHSKLVQDFTILFEILQFLFK